MVVKTTPREEKWTLDSACVYLNVYDQVFYKLTEWLKYNLFNKCHVSLAKTDGNHKSAMSELCMYTVPFWILRIYCSTKSTDDNVFLGARGWFYLKEKCHNLTNNSAVFLFPPFEISLPSSLYAGDPS